MELYEELKEAINECMESSDESPEFKRRFYKLIENFFDKSANESDIRDVIELIKLPEGNS